MTKKQRLILDAIVFLLRKGELPTVREVGKLAGLSSPATVLKHLRALEAEGHISMSGKSRGIRLADPELLDALFAGAATGALQTGALRTGALRTGALQSILQGHFSRLSLQLREPSGDRPSGDRPSGDHRLPVVGAIAAGRPIDPRTEAFLASDSTSSDSNSASNVSNLPCPCLAIDPRMFASSGELVALQVEGESMIDAGILPGDYVIIRRQDCVEEGEIAAVLVDGETTLKRWHRQQRSGRSARIASGPAAVFSGGPSGKLSRARQESKETVETVETVRLVAANERFAPIEITEDDRKEVIVFGKYVGLVRGELRIV